MRGRLVLIAAVAAALLAPAAAHGATFTVTKQTDTADGACDADCSLREAVIAANATTNHDVIVLPAGAHTLTIDGPGEDAAATGDLDLTRNVSFRGAGSGAGGTTVDAGPIADRAFHVLGPSGEGDFQDLRITGGDGSGGAIRNDDGDVQIRRVAFDANIGTIIGEDGGAIVNAGPGTFSTPEMVVSDSSFTGNQAGGAGGAIQNLDEGRLTVVGSRFSGNRAGPTGLGSGGAIDNQGHGRLVIQRSTFSGNVAVRGGVLVNHEDASATVSDSTLTGHVLTPGTQSTGGAIFLQNDAVLTVLRSVIADNVAEDEAGGIYAQNDTTLLLVDSSVSGNRTQSTSATSGGGALDLRNQVVAVIDSSTISGNTSTRGGGGINYESEHPLLISNSTISGNRADTNGGGIRALGRANIAIESSTIAGNSAGGSGGGLANDLSPSFGTAARGAFSIQDTIVSGNVAAAAGQQCSDSSGLGFGSQGNNLDSGSECGFNVAGDVQNGSAALGALADNGGATQTHALLSGSQAVDAGSGGCPPVDQRDVPRPQQGGCDIGAFELTPPGAPPPPPPATVQTVPGPVQVVTAPAAGDPRPPFAPVSLADGLRDVDTGSGRVLTLELSCAEQQLPACLFELSGRTGSIPVASDRRAGSSQRRPRRRAVQLPSRALAVPSGQSRRIRVSLPRAVALELRRRGRVSLRLVIAQVRPDGSTATTRRSLVLRMPARSARVSRTGRVRVEALFPAGAAPGETATVELRRGSGRLGAARVRATPGRMRTVTVRLSRSALTALRRSRRVVAEVHVTYRDAAGRARTDRRRLTLLAPR
ncbi:MAG: choice-of-anchor Q domain-containing protein [Thermoleophilaceae bacterium]